MFELLASAQAGTPRVRVLGFGFGVQGLEGLGVTV